MHNGLRSTVPFGVFNGTMALGITMSVCQFLWSTVKYLNTYLKCHENLNGYDPKKEHCWIWWSPNFLSSNTSRFVNWFKCYLANVNMLTVILNVRTLNNLLIVLNTIFGMAGFKNLSKQVTTNLLIRAYWQGCSAKGRQWRSSAEASLPAAVPAVLLSDAVDSTHVTNDYINLPGSPRIRSGESSVWMHIG